MGWWLRLNQQRSREEILHEQVKLTERELARLRRELKEVIRSRTISTDNARHPQHGEESQDDEHGAD